MIRAFIIAIRSLKTNRTQIVIYLMFEMKDKTVCILELMIIIIKRIHFDSQNKVILRI